VPGPRLLGSPRCALRAGPVCEASASAVQTCRRCPPLSIFPSPLVPRRGVPFGSEQLPGSGKYGGACADPRRMQNRVRAPGPICTSPSQTASLERLRKPGHGFLFLPDQIVAGTQMNLRWTNNCPPIQIRPRKSSPAKWPRKSVNFERSCSRLSELEF
jgi:hypothetical protein